MFKRVLILSDTHFTDRNDPLLARVLATARGLDLRGSGDAVVLAGDIFDLYVGSKAYFREEFAAWHTLVQEWVERGVHVDYVEGNHDFQLAGVFGPSVWVHPEGLELPIAGGARLWVEHGDLIDASDIGYRVLRALLRSPFFRAFISSAPDAWVRWVGEKMRAASHARHPRQPEPAQQERLRTIYGAAARTRWDAGFQWVVAGHCHDLHATADGQRQYFNMGYPRVHGQLVLLRDGQLERLRIE